MKRARRQGECGSGSWLLFPGKPSAVNPLPSSTGWSPGRQALTTAKGGNDPEHRIGFWKKGPTSNLSAAHFGLPSELRVELGFLVLESDHSFLDAQT